MHKVIVIGAGIGGLTTAALLAKAGLDVTVLEAHVYPGGCAGTFYHQGYRFDAGATLAGGFYDGGPWDLVASATGIDHWSVRPSDLTMRVHMPDGTHMDRWADERRYAARLEYFGEESRRFFEWQERTADALWSLALRNPPWPPQTVSDATRLAVAGTDWALEDITRLKPGLAVDAFRSVSAHLKSPSRRLRTFVDGQLLIAAQAISQHTNALYGASALDLPRRGVVHVPGGIGVIADTLAGAVRQNGGKVVYRQQAKRIITERGHPVAVKTTRGDVFDADIVVANLTPWNLVPLLDDPPRRLHALPRMPRNGWGAMTVYVGLDDSIVPDDAPLHHQVITTWDADGFGEGNTLFLSLNPAWDKKRAPIGHRVLTLSTHTNLGTWWDLFENERSTYEARKEAYSAHLLAVAETALPGLRDAARLILPGTPVTFQRFTRRQWGWVGGFPQTSLFEAWGPRIAPRLWMVGDSIFPGQSIAAVALGGIRVAKAIIEERVKARNDFRHSGWKRKRIYSSIADPG
jgi:C-3',4' desaturase CrtD